MSEPIEIEICPACDGRGWFWNVDAGFRCQSCDGTGHVKTAAFDPAVLFKDLPPVLVALAPVEATMSETLSAGDTPQIEIKLGDYVTQVNGSIGDNGIVREIDTTGKTPYTYGVDFEDGNGWIWFAAGELKLSDTPQPMNFYKVGDEVVCGDFSYKVKAIDGNRCLLSNADYRAWNDQPVSEFWEHWSHIDYEFGGEDDPQYREGVEPGADFYEPFGKPASTMTGNDTPMQPGDALAAALARIAELERENRRLDSLYHAAKSERDWALKVEREYTPEQIEKMDAIALEVFEEIDRDEAEEAAKTARIAELEAALKPFADAAEDKDVALAESDDSLYVADQTWKDEKVPIQMGSNSLADWLSVGHLRAAATALKAGKP